MKQMSLGESGFERKTKRARKREFLDEMNLVVPLGRAGVADCAARSQQFWPPNAKSRKKIVGWGSCCCDEVPTSLR